VVSLSASPAPRNRAIYNFQHLTFNGQTQLQIVGPVIVTVASGFTANGLLGSTAQSAWLTLNLYSGGFTLNGGCAVYGYVNAPTGTVIINGNSQLVGGVTSDRLTVNGSGVLRLLAPPSTNLPPTVAVTAPADGSSFTAPASFNLSASASDGDGSVTKVEFFRGTTLLGTDAIAPYELALSGLTAGTYEFTARATDSNGASTDSAPITVTVTNPNQPPTVILTAPADGTLFTAPSAFTLVADAQDPDGSIAKVEFYQGTAKLGEDTAAPYEQSISGLAAGTYAFTAVAYDNQNAFATSTVVTVTVVNPNQSPSVSLIAPANNSSYPASATFTLVADASDPDGTIDRVEFYCDGTLLGRGQRAALSVRRHRSRRGQSCVCGPGLRQ